MGCGQSKIHLYPRKSKSKANGKKSGHIDTDADADEEEGHIDENGEKDNSKDKDKIEEETTLSDGKSSPEPPNGEISVSLLRAKNLSLLQSQEISSSQQNFFKMLDQKIEEGPDYDSASETEIALEEARLNALVQHWESASLTASLCSSASRSLQTTPVRQVPIRPPPPFRHPMNSIPPQPLSAELLPHNPQQAMPIGLGVGIGGGLVVCQQQYHPIPQQSPQQLQQLQQMQQLQQQMQQLPQQQQLQLQQLQQQQPQVQQPAPEYRFPPAISVNRLAPQVQRQIRETQELIKDSCSQLYAAGYGSPGPPLRAQPRNATRRPTLETQYSQELS